MLLDYPVLFNGEKIITPTSWSESYAVVENVNETEAGTEQVSVTRYGKLSVSASFQCSSRWAGKLKAYSHEDSIRVSLFDIESNGYSDYSMRIRGFKAEPKMDSYRVSRSNGLWNISFNLEEF